MFIGRKKELKELKNRYDSNKFEMGIIYGQRRIGKSSLILRSLEGYEHFYFLGRPTTLKDNIDAFEYKINEFMNLPYLPHFNTFDEGLDALIRYVDKRKFIIIIDELPFLAKVYPAIMSYLQGLVDRIIMSKLNIKIILSGSDVSFMMDILKDSGKPLYQRSTFQIHLKELNYSDALLILDGMSNEDKIKSLAVFGNHPFYLGMIDTSLSFDKNIKRLCFDKYSILLDAPNLVLPLGWSTNGVYMNILKGLANRKQKPKLLSDYLGIEQNALATYLSRMMECGAIVKKETFNGNAKSVYYEILDRFINIYFNIIDPNREKIEMGFGNEVYKSNSTIIEEEISHGFELVVISFMNELNYNNKLPSKYMPIQQYKVDNSKLGRSIEIDGITESFDKNKLLVIEAKFRNKKISNEVLTHLKESASIFNSYETIDYYLFAKNSFTNELINLHEDNVHLITINDMIK